MGQGALPCICTFLCLYFLHTVTNAELQCPTVSPVNNRPLILDTDVDIDDVMGLIYLVLSGADLRLVTVNGNAWAHLGPGTQNVFDVLDFLGRTDIDVAMGAAYPLIETKEYGKGTYGYTYQQHVPEGGDGNGRMEIDLLFGIGSEYLPRSKRGWKPSQDTAVPAMWKVLQNVNSDEVVDIISFGSLTNLAMLLLDHPEAREKIGVVYIMGGAVHVPGNMFPSSHNIVAELNFFMDPHAAQLVFRSGINITLIPLDMTNTVPMTNEWWDSFSRPENHNAAPAEFVWRLQGAFKDAWQPAGTFFDNIFVWDTLTGAVALDPKWMVESTSLRLDVIASGDIERDGALVVSPDGQEVKVGLRGDPAFLVHLGEVLNRPAQCQLSS